MPVLVIALSMSSLGTWEFPGALAGWAQKLLACKHPAEGPLQWGQPLLLALVASMP